MKQPKYYQESHDFYYLFTLLLSVNVVQPWTALFKKKNNVKLLKTVLNVVTLLRFTVTTSPTFCLSQLGGAVATFIIPAHS